MLTPHCHRTVISLCTSVILTKIRHFDSYFGHLMTLPNLKILLLQSDIFSM